MRRAPFQEFAPSKPTVRLRNSRFSASRLAMYWFFLSSSSSASASCSDKRSFISPAPTAKPSQFHECTCISSHSFSRLFIEACALTANELDQSPQPQQYKQSGEFTLLSAQHHLKHKRSNHDARVKQVESSIGPSNARRVVLRSKCP